MNARRIIGIIILLIGIGLVGYGYYGKGEMAAARQKIDESGKFLPQNELTDPIVDPLQDEVTRPMKQPYYDKVDSYEGTVRQLFIWGWVCIGVGFLLVVIPRRKS